MSKIGIFSGTFDPVHKGHITFALEAMREGGLSEVYFLPEQQPRHKQGVTHYAHRIAMLKLALTPYQNLHLLELPDRRFDIAKTLPRLEGKFGVGLSLLMGSDTFASLALNKWANQDELLRKCPLIVGLRIGQSEAGLRLLRELLPATAQVQFIQAGNYHAASSDIRSALQRGKHHDGHLTSLHNYINENWLYVGVPVTEESAT